MLSPSQETSCALEVGVAAGADPPPVVPIPGETDMVSTIRCSLVIGAEERCSEALTRLRRSQMQFQQLRRVE